MGFNNDLPEYVRQQSNEGDGNYYVHIALMNNGRLSDEAWMMKNLACELEDTLPEYSKKNTNASKYQNQLFSEFRKWLRKCYHSSIGPVTFNKPNKEDREIIESLESYMDEPYGTFPISKLTRPALMYFHMLEVKGLVPVSYGFNTTSGITKFNQG